MAGGEDKMVKCIDCKKGTFMQWMANPIICECTINNERLVAESRRLCTRFERSYAKPTVTHYDHY